MSSTENDLRTLLEERGAGGGGGTAQLEAILARGREIRRRRAVATVAAIVTAGALAVAVVAPSLSAGDRGEAPIVAVAADPPPVPGKDLPATVKDVLNKEVRLLQTYRGKTLGSRRIVKFTPTSTFTGFRVVCEDPRAMVVTMSGMGRYRSGSAGECGKDLPGLSIQKNERSLLADWTSNQQSMTIWVLPPAPPISREAMQNLKCPEKETEKTGMCGGQYVTGALVNPRTAERVIERVAAKVGTKPGRWAIGVYDRPSS